MGSTPLKQSHLSPKSARQARRPHLSILLPTKRFTSAAPSRRRSRNSLQTPRRAVGLLSCVGVVVRFDSPVGGPRGTDVQKVQLCTARSLWKSFLLNDVPRTLQHYRR